MGIPMQSSKGSSLPEAPSRGLDLGLLVPMLVQRWRDGVIQHPPSGGLSATCHSIIFVPNSGSYALNIYWAPSPVFGASDFSFFHPRGNL